MIEHFNRADCCVKLTHHQHIHRTCRNVGEEERNLLP